VLLPYVDHFGTSGVLSRAMAAGRMVIVSDEQLLGRLTRDHGLGLLFPSGDANALRDSIQKASLTTREEFASYARAAARYAAFYSREAYRAALLKSVAVND
jgi:glycosyltransferase involved in cell wall biosynthesis